MKFLVCLVLVSLVCGISAQLQRRNIFGGFGGNANLLAASGAFGKSHLGTVVPTKSDSDAILCLQLLSKTLTCTLHLS